MILLVSWFKLRLDKITGKDFCGFLFDLVDLERSRSDFLG